VQPIVACMAERHKELVPYCDAKELYNDAHAKFFRRITALKEHEEAVARLHTARAATFAQAQAQARALHCGEPILCCCTRPH
jgi:hypothetical protein